MKKRMKRILFLLLTLLFMAGMPVQNVSAGGMPSGLYIGSVTPVELPTSDLPYCYGGNEGGAGTQTAAMPDSGDYTWLVQYDSDNSSYTLTLNGTDISLCENDGMIYGICAAGFDLNLILSGANTVGEAVPGEAISCGIYIEGNLFLSGSAGGSLTIDSCVFGIYSNGYTDISDAAVSINVMGENAVGVYAEDDLRISGSADVTIADWSEPDRKCGLRSSRNIAIGGNTRVDICSQSCGMYAEDTVYIGYEWSGTEYNKAGNPTIIINDPDSIAAAQAASGGATFIAGPHGIKADEDVLISAGQVTITTGGESNTCFRASNMTISGGNVSAAGQYGVQTFSSFVFSGGRLTAAGNESAIANWDGGISLPAVPYKYRYSTEAAEPGALYTPSDETPYTYSADHKYLEIGQIYSVTYNANGGAGAVPAENSKIGGETFVAANCSLIPPSDKVFKEWNTRADGTGARYLPGNTVTMPEGELSLHAIWGTPVSISAVAGVTLPVRGAVPASAVTETAEYTGSVAWTPAHNPFAASTVYTATITLTPKGGYTLSTVAQNFFTVNGAASVTNSAGSGVITAVFPETEALPPSSGDGGYSPAPSTPTYNADVQAGEDGTSTLPVTVNTDAGTASVETGSRALTALDAVVTIPAVPDTSTYIIGIPVPDLSTTDQRNRLTIETENGSLTVPSNMLTDVAGTDGSKAQISIGQGNKSALPEEVKAAIGTRPLIQLTLSIDGMQANWNNPNAPVMVRIPYTPTAEDLMNPESIVIWYIDGGGNVITIPNGRYDAASGTVVFTTTHFSDYAVGYNKVAFGDVAADDWYNESVNFIAARGITGGTGGGNFSPDALLTRGEFLVMLMKAYSISPDVNPLDNFSDAGDTYYTSYLAAAKRLGITAGVGNNMYAPGNQITRQEMFTLLYNALKVIRQLPEGQKSPEGDSGKTLSDFTDYGQIAPWASEAMTLLVKAGAVSGSGGTLNLVGTATRAEMAQMLYNLL